MGTLDGKVIIITGAARGQGEAEAELAAQAGAKVVVTDIIDGESVAKKSTDFSFNTMSLRLSSGAKLFNKHWLNTVASMVW